MKIILSNRSDSVLLFKNNGQASDVYTYGVIRAENQTWCRLPDGLDEWVFGCEPTPNDVNRLATTIPVVNDQPLAAMCISSTILPVVYQAECVSAGLEIWSPQYWLGSLQSSFPLYIERDDQLNVIE
jgi:hypothetical protein